MVYTDPVLIRSIYKVEWNDSLDGDEVARKLNENGHEFIAIPTSNNDISGGNSSDEESDIESLPDIARLQITEQEKISPFLFQLKIGELGCHILDTCAVVVGAGNEDKESLIHSIFQNIAGSHSVIKTNEIHKARLGFEPKIFLEPRNQTFLKSFESDKKWWRLEFENKKGLARVFKNGTVLFSDIMNPDHLNTAWSLVKEHTCDFYTH